MNTAEMIETAASEVAYEPCPYCQGTGRRIKPPPPMPRGGPKTKPGTGPRHGYESSYAAGCRCDLCKAARREGVRRRNREKVRR